MSTPMPPILIVDDDPDIREVLKDRLVPLGFPVLTAENGRRALELATDEEPFLVFLDLQMPLMDGMEVLRRLRGRTDLAIVVITAHGTVERAVEAMREGAFDFVTKPFSMDYLDAVIRRVIERSALKRENLRLKAEIDGAAHDIVGKSPKLEAAMEVARKVSATASTVLLLGESGTGKEVFARWIHRWSPRASGPFVAINCVALRDELLESELFGHERGAFTGAHETRQGRLELAHGGTVFLDEIGDFKPELQAKLLRVLQEREFERVGGNRKIRVDIRVIAATHRDLREDVREGRFREDLFFRLNVVAIPLPPLRERREDVPLLAEHFLHRLCQEMSRPGMKITPAAMSHMVRYGWPGNVRELANLIERAVILAADGAITPEDLPLPPAGVGNGGEGIDGLTYREAVRRYQRRLIRQTLQATGGNQARAAELLGMQRTYLSRLIRKLDIADANDTS